MCIDVLKLLIGLKSRGLSILFIPRDLCLGYDLRDQSMILDKGQGMEKGSQEKIYDPPGHPHTKMLTKSVPRVDRNMGGRRSTSKS